MDLIEKYKWLLKIADKKNIIQVILKYFEIDLELEPNYKYEFIENGFIIYESECNFVFYVTKDNYFLNTVYPTYEFHDVFDNEFNQIRSEFVDTKSKKETFYIDEDYMEYGYVYLKMLLESNNRLYQYGLLRDEEPFIRSVNWNITDFKTKDVTEFNVAESEDNVYYSLLNSKVINDKTYVASAEASLNTPCLEALTLKTIASEQAQDHPYMFFYSGVVKPKISLQFLKIVKKENKIIFNYTTFSNNTTTFEAISDVYDEISYDDLSIIAKNIKANIPSGFAYWIIENLNSIRRKMLEKDREILFEVTPCEVKCLQFNDLDEEVEDYLNNREFYKNLLKTDYDFLLARKKEKIR